MRIFIEFNSIDDMLAFTKDNINWNSVYEDDFTKIEILKNNELYNKIYTIMNLLMYDYNNSQQIPHIKHGNTITIKLKDIESLYNYSKNYGITEISSYKYNDIEGSLYEFYIIK